MASNLLILALTLLTCMPVVSGQLSKYSKWVPYGMRYCETLQDTTNPLAGGVTCGYSSWFAMTNLFPTQISSNVSLGFINVGWLTSEALGSESGFWKTCKSYLVRVFDGIYKNASAACPPIVNPPNGLPNCTDNNTNLNYRSGNGYCLKSKVCGASIAVDFYKSPDGTALIWAWLPSVISTLTSNGYIKTGTCYAYSKLANPGMNETNMYNADSSVVF